MNLVRGARASRSSRCTVIARAPRGPAAPAPAPPPTASSARARNTSPAPSSTSFALRRHRTRHITLMLGDIQPLIRSSLSELSGWLHTYWCRTIERTDGRTLDHQSSHTVSSRAQSGRSSNTGNSRGQQPRTARGAARRREAGGAAGGGRRSVGRGGGGRGRASAGRAAAMLPRDALMLFLPTRRREKAPRGFKLLYVDKTLL